MSATSPYTVDLAVKNVQMVVQPEVNTPDSQIPGSFSDPNSAASLQRAMTSMLGQAQADRRYDVAVPQPKKLDGFCDHNNTNLTLSLVAATLMVGLALIMRKRR
jgi:hypothetical protein